MPMPMPTPKIRLSNYTSFEVMRAWNAGSKKVRLRKADKIFKRLKIEKSLEQLRFWRFPDQINRNDANCNFKIFRTSEWTNERTKRTKLFRKISRKIFEKSFGRQRVKSSSINGSSQQLMCEIDNAVLMHGQKMKIFKRPEKSRGWLGFWRCSDQKIAATQAVWWKISNERKVPENFEKLSKILSKNSRNRHWRRH